MTKKNAFPIIGGIYRPLIAERIFDGMPLMKFTV